jgi:hypothetical protein
MPKASGEIVPFDPSVFKNAVPLPIPLAAPPANPPAVLSETTGPNMFQPPDPKTWAMLTPVQKKAVASGLGLNVQTSAAEQAQEEANAKSKFVEDVSAVIPVAATLATGGMAAPLAIGTMGAAAASAGAISEAAKLGVLPGMKGQTASDAAQSPAQIARRLGVDFTLGAVSEGGVRLTGKLLEAAGTAFYKPMIATAAEQSQQGQTILNEFGEQQLNRLRNMFAEAGSPRASIQRELDTLQAHVALSETGTSEGFKNAWKNIMEKVREWETQGSPAAGLVKLKGDLSQIGFKKTGLHYTEENALQTFADQIDKKAAFAVRQYGGQEASELYAGYKETAAQTKRFSASLELGESFAKRFAYRTAYGFALGTGAGFGGGGGDMTSMMLGAAIGAGVGAAAQTSMVAFEKYVAPALLKHMLADKVAAPLTKQAITAMENGNAKEAMSIFTRAAAQVGAKEFVQNASQGWAEENAAKTRMEQMARTPAPTPLQPPPQR